MIKSLFDVALVDRTTLLRKIWITRGARLEAVRRIERQIRASRAASAIASVILVTVGVLGMTSPDAVVSQTINLVMTSGALLVLVLSLLDSGLQKEMRADRLHTSARRMGDLHDEASLDASVSDQQLRERYHRILDQFPDNHDPLDWEMFARSQPSVYTVDQWTRVSIWLKWQLSSQRPWLIAVGIAASFFVVLRYLQR